MNNSAKGVVTLCRLENGQVEIILGVPGVCDHPLLIPIPTAETMKEKCPINNSMTFFQTLILAQLPTCRIVSCLLHTLDRNGYAKLFSAAWAVASPEVKGVFTELQNDVQKMPKQTFVFDAWSQHVPEPLVAPSASSSSSVDVTVENCQHSKTHQAERSEMLSSTHNPFERTMDMEINYALQPESTTGDVMDMDINRPQHWPISSPNGPSRVNSGNDNDLEDDLYNMAMNHMGKLHDPFLPFCGVITPAMSSCSSKGSGDDSESSNEKYLPEPPRHSSEERSMKPGVSLVGPVLTEEPGEL